MMTEIWDMHIHLDFMRNALEITKGAAVSGFGLFGVTVTPQGYIKAQKELYGLDNVRLGVGLHPWWAADGRCGNDDAFLAANLIRKTRFVGEIGLDASPKHVSVSSLPLQIEIFKMLCSTSAEYSDPYAKKVLSIHSVKACTLVLDILEQTGCFENCFCIFHWFTGSSDEMNRAVRSGCMFSVNEMMLSTRRGHEYVRQLPSDRLLLETDLPPGENTIFSVEKIQSSLNRTLAELSSIKGSDMLSAINENTRQILFPAHTMK